VSLVSAELFKANFGLSTVEVKYKESASATNDMLGGNLSFVYIDPAGSAANVKLGKVRALAVTTKNRLQSLPDIPGSGEAGIANTDLYSWWTVHTPKGTPKPILQQLEAIFNEIVAAPDTRKFLANAGCDPFPGNSRLANDLIVSGVKQWGEYVKLAKIEPLS
jgi:tripartite-type tricarboxylate transporter receptor subunit TctC